MNCILWSICLSVLLSVGEKISRTAADAWKDLLYLNTEPKDDLVGECRKPEFEFPPSTSLGSERAERAKNAPARPLTDLDGARRIGILFLTIRGVTTGTYWERWLLDARDYITEQLHLPVADVLSTLVAFSPAFERDAVIEYLPPSLKGSLMSFPQPSVWGEQSRSERQLIYEAYIQHPHIAYFIIVSHNTIPVKSFEYMYEEIMRDTRMRVSMSELDIGIRGLFKTAEWRALPRRIVKIMLQDPDYPQVDWLYWRGGQSCAADECRVWEPVIKRLREATFDDLIFYPVEEAVAQWGLPAHFFFDCWEDDIYGCPRKGRVGTEPSYYKELDKTFLDQMINHPHIWTFRKADDETTVSDTNGTLAVDYISARLGSGHKDVYVNQPAHDNTLPTLKYQGATYEEQVRLWIKHQVYGLRSDMNVSVAST